MKDSSIKTARTAKNRPYQRTVLRKNEVTNLDKKIMDMSQFYRIQGDKMLELEWDVSSS